MLIPKNRLILKTVRLAKAAKAAKQVRIRSQVKTPPIGQKRLLERQVVGVSIVEVLRNPSAQKIFALFLARINDVFENHITPHSSSLDRQQIDEIIEDKIVQPTLQDMGAGFEHFTIPAITSLISQSAHTYIYSGVTRGG